MAEIVNIDEHRPHLSGEAACMECGHEWVAVTPVGNVVLDCPACGCHKGALVNYAMRDNNPIWACGACGNYLFFVHPDGCACARCGTYIDLDNPPAA